MTLLALKTQHSDLSGLWCNNIQVVIGSQAELSPLFFWFLDVVDKSFTSIAQVS